MTFTLDPVLQKDSYFICDLELCQVRLIDNSDFPWVILVPRKDDISEITDLTETEYYLLSQEIRAMTTVMQGVFAPDKLNIATIGNVVPQMHYHIVARYKNDRLFPKPVWGLEFNNYENNEESARIKAIVDFMESSPKT